MPVFTVIEATKKKDVPDGKYGPSQVIGLHLRNEAGTEGRAEWFTKAATPLPVSGSTLEGTVEQTEHGSKFKKAQGQFGGGPRGMSPEDRAQIVRQHSQEMALRALDLAFSLGVISKPEDSAKLFKIIEGTTTWFVKDAAKVPS